MNDHDMRIQNLIRRFAGSFVLVSLALGYWVHPAWFLFTAFVGVNLIQSSFTKWCLLEKILYRVLPPRKASAS
ncbi:MAG TPA: DUF2892 domain-containing protein [Candidatus Krumholzibacteria bacterium]|nr:DUF2892 domain-containing protein [Candidatus Krumholzibacteria bacterium]